MKKFLPIIVGVCGGIVLSGALIVADGFSTAHGEDNGIDDWNSIVAASESVNWGDIFGQANGQNTYSMIRDKIVDRGEREALKEVASMYGLTTEEAKSVLGGSMLPILNNPDNSMAVMTQEKAAGMMLAMQDKFAFMKELLEIEQEVDTAISPSEIFANGDKEDSGFDLVDDLNIIEVILFNEVTEVSVGGQLAGAFDSPIPQAYKDAAVDSNESLYGNGDENDGLVLNDDGTASIGVGEEVVDAEVLEEDVCPEENILGDALGHSEATAEGSGEAGDDGGSGDDDDNGDNGNEDGDPISAVPGDWGSEFCPGGIGGEADSGAGADEGFSSLDSLPETFSGMTSLGSGSLIGAGAGAGAGAGFESPGFEVNIGVCLTVDMIKGTTSSEPDEGPTCLECEVDAINSLLEETMSHSLVAHKSPGNLMESGKCKDPGIPISVNFVTIWNPVSTPPNDDLILGKNVFEEWNKFAEQYKPLLLDKITFPDKENPHLNSSTQSKIIQQGAPSSYSQGELLIQLLEVKDKYAAEAAAAVEDFDLANTGTNGMLYTNNVLAEIQQMNVLFKNYNATYKKIIENALANTISKGYQDG
jgi:hypothetical protein